MMQRTPRNVVYYLFNTVQVSALALTPLIGGTLKLTPEHIEKAETWSLGFAELVAYAQTEAWWLIIVLSIAAGVSKVICSKIGAPWMWDALQSMLDELREHAFKVNADDPSHHHRVTLFKHVRFRLRISPWRAHYWPWGRNRSPFSGWLVPVLRSGHTTQRTKTVFLAPDDADHAEGVAGKTWSCNRSIYKRSLPNLECDSPENDIANYAKDTWISPEMIRKRVEKRRSLARSYY
jgi:hypothetical protein